MHGSSTERTVSHHQHNHNNQQHNHQVLHTRPASRHHNNHNNHNHHHHASNGKDAAAHCPPPASPPPPTTTATTTTSTPRMACDKASRRLRATLLKAERWGLTARDLASLPAARRIVSQRDRDWKLAVLLLLMFGGGVIVALVCTQGRGACSKIEEINLAT